MRALCLVAAAMLMACIARRVPVGGAPANPGSVASTADPGTSEGTIPLRVDNNNYNDVTVWLEVDGQRTRVATVTGSTGADFSIAARNFEPSRVVRLAAEMAGARGVRTDANDQIRMKRVATDRLMVRPGQRVVWTLESTLERSHFAVY